MPIRSIQAQKRRRALVHATSPRGHAIEQLEDRVLLSTINWANRTTTDNFGALGANTAAGRAIVDRAIDDWERVVTNFNYVGGGNTFSVSITIADLGPAARGSTGVSYNAQQRPTSANITLDDNGGGSGWYFDQTVGTALIPDDSEFTTLINPFQADGAVAGFDFYRTIAHELGHAMGLASSSPLLQGLDTDIGDDPVDGGSAHLFTIDVNGVPGADYCYTNSGGFHLYEGPSVGGNPIHPNELMNSGRTAVAGRRQLISDTIATLLRDAYAYTVTLPGQINTFYTNLNTTTDTITVTGDADYNNDDTDAIALGVSGSSMTFGVNGTSETIAGAEFTSITVNSLEAADQVDVNGVLASKSVAINLGNAGDNCAIAPALGDIDSNILANVTVNGGGGTDALIFNDATDESSVDDNYTLTSGSLTKSSAPGRSFTFNTMESVKLDANAFDNTISINGIASGVALTVNGNGGNDTFNVGNGEMDANFVGGTLTIDGGAGTSDTVVFDDTTDDAGADAYTITSSTLNKVNFSAPIDYSGFETQRLDASPNADSIVMNSSFPNWRINGNVGIDDISVVGNQIGSTVTVDAGGNSDTVHVNNDNSGTASVTFPSTQTLSLLEIGNGGTAILSPGGNKVLVTNTLTNTAGGTLDLTNNDAIINYTGVSPISTVRSQLITGRNGGAWTGTGITSSTAAAVAANAADTHKTALGYADASTIGSPGTFGGISIDNTSVLIRYTYVGDANLDGLINALDFNALASNFGGSGKQWVQADYNYDGTTNSFDFNAISTNWGFLLPAPPVEQAPLPAADRAGGIFSNNPIGANAYQTIAGTADFSDLLGATDEILASN